MGPRPTRPRLPVPAGASRPAPVVITTSRQVAPVGAPSPRRTASVETVPLPAETRRALSGIVKQLRDVPRAIIGDPAEVVHFLGRTARALERLRDTPVPLAPLPAMTSSRASAPLPGPVSPTRAISARERAEAAFKPPPSSAAAPMSGPAPAGLPVPRTITDRRGRGVRVEVRKARAAGQLEMPV